MRIVLLIAVVVAGCGGGESGTDASVPIDAFVPTDSFNPGDAMPADAALPIDAPMALDAPMPIDATALDAPESDAAPDCLSDADCEDGDLCSLEACSGGTCVVFDAIRPCSDGMDCTADSCDPVVGCVFTPIDADADGIAACVDCDDTRGSVRPGAVEVCNGLDDDCDGTIDDGLGRTWWADCDGDSVAAASAATTTACATPTLAVTGCTGAEAIWTDDDPSTYPDCDDSNPSIRPARFSWETVPIPGRPPETDFDYNCNDVETMQYTTIGSCTPRPDGSFGCVTVTGWQGSIPECGASAELITNCGASPGPGGTVECNPITSTRIQGCY